MTPADETPEGELARMRREVAWLQERYDKATRDIRRLLNMRRDVSAVVERDALRIEVERVRRERDVAVAALLDMASQYLSEDDGRLSHSFMSTGEYVLPLLERMGYIQGEEPFWTWTDKPWPSLRDPYELPPSGPTMTHVTVWSQGGELLYEADLDGEK